mgnify:CR=1 FL=1
MATAVNEGNGCLEYPAGYVIREKPENQIAAWTNFLPKLDAGEIFRMLPYPRQLGVEEIFIVPKPHVFASSLGSATRFVLNCIGIDAGKIPVGVLERSERTESALYVFSKIWRGDFWLIPAQLGFCRRGESMKQVRRSYADKEFGFDLYLATACLVSHSGRLTGEQWELGIDCPGNNNYIVNGFLPKAPCFQSFSGRRACNLNIVVRPNARFGSATGFLPSS